MPQNPTAFTDALARGVLVFDGAMGTEIYRHHVFTNRSFDELCLSDPKLIETIHRDYCEAGADVLTTNTFGAQRLGLEKYGLADKVCDINRAGAAIARRVADAADRPVLVAGSIGPLAAQWQSAEAIEEMIAEQVAALWEGGADFIIFETQPSRAALEQCAAAMRRQPGGAVHPLLHGGRPGRIGRRRADRTPAGPAARRRAAADRLGAELRHRARRPARARSSGRSA